MNSTLKAIHLVHLINFIYTGITGAAMCYAVSPTKKRGSLGSVSLGEGVSQYQGFAVEMILTFILMLTILAATDPNREDKTFGPALSIGLAVSVCHFVGVCFAKCILLFHLNNV